MLQWTRFRGSVALSAMVIVATAAPALAGPGDLDRGFGEGGVVDLPDPGIEDHGLNSAATAPAANGQIWTLANSWDYHGSHDHVVISRLLPDGSVDRSFARRGLKVWELSKRGPHPGTWAGRIVGVAGGGVQVSGSYERHPESRLHVGYTARFLPDGRLDRSYAHDGVLEQTFQRRRHGTVSQQPDGSVIRCNFYENQLRIWRYAPDGGPDVTFSNDGHARLQLPDGGSPLGCTWLANGDVLYGHYTSQDYQVLATLVRVTSSGQLDPDYGEGGIVRALLPESFDREGTAFFPDGSVMFGGRLRDASEAWLAIYALTAEGDPDLDFGGGDALAVGDALAIRDINDNFGLSIVKTMAGAIVVTGTSFLDKDGGSGMFVARFAPEGRLDREFGDGGATRPIGHYSMGSTVRIDAVGRLVLSAHDYELGGAIAVRLKG